LIEGPVDACKCVFQAWPVRVDFLLERRMKIPLHWRPVRGWLRFWLADLASLSAMLMHRKTEWARQLYQRTVTSLKVTFILSSNHFNSHARFPAIAK
jgi:hypothetical protein